MHQSCFMCNWHVKESNPQHLQECTATLPRTRQLLVINQMHHHAPSTMVLHIGLFTMLNNFSPDGSDFSHQWPGNYIGGPTKSDVQSVSGPVGDITTAPYVSPSLKPQETLDNQLNRVDWPLEYHGQIPLTLYAMPQRRSYDIQEMQLLLTLNFLCFT